MTVKVNLGDWADRIHNPKNIETALAYKVAELSDPYVPYLAGDLSSHKKIYTDDAGAHIAYDEKYAHYQYEGLSKNGNSLKYTTTHHPNAGPHWIERVKGESMSQMTKYVAEAIIHGAENSRFR